MSHERSAIAGAESFYALEANICSTAGRGISTLPGSKATSRAKGSHVDRLTWRRHRADLGYRLEELHGRAHRGAYRALPSRRVYIPKPDGGQGPLSLAALEDNILQRAVARLLNAIYEEDCLGISFGFRPGRGTHDALAALCVGIGRKNVSFILDTDSRSFFDEIDRQWLIRRLELRIGDRRIIRWADEVMQ